MNTKALPTPCTYHDYIALSDDGKQQDEVIEGRDLADPGAVAPLRFFLPPQLSGIGLRKWLSMTVTGFRDCRSGFSND